MSIYPTPYVIDSIKQGLSANEGLRQFRAGGGKIGRSAWLALRAEVGAALANRESEMSANLNSVPATNEQTTFTTTNASGFIQQVEVLYRVKGSDVIVNRPFSVKGDTLITRQQAIESALDTMSRSQQSGNYGEQVILGAAYVGTYNLVPGGV